MNFISQNPYFLKNLTNFEVEEFEVSRNMFSTFITSKKSRSMIYKFMLAKLRELARPKVLNYKYDDKMSLLTIDIWEDYYFWWYVNKDMVINLDLWKFIIAKIWNSFYNYLILHRWLIPSKLERRFKSMMIYMKRYKHSKNIKFKGAMLFHKIKPVGMIDNVFNLIAWSSFPEIWLQISYSDISNWIGTTFSKIMKLYSSSVQKIIIAVINNSDYIEWENPSSNNLIKVMLAEYGVNYHTYVLYKFLENSRLLDSIKKNWVYRLPRYRLHYFRKSYCQISKKE